MNFFNKKCTLRYTRFTNPFYQFCLIRMQKYKILKQVVISDIAKTSLSLLYMRKYILMRHITFQRKNSQHINAITLASLGIQNLPPRIKMFQSHYNLMSHEHNDIMKLAKCYEVYVIHFIYHILFSKILEISIHRLENNGYRKLHDLRKICLDKIQL